MHLQYDINYIFEKLDFWLVFHTVRLMIDKPELATENKPKKLINQYFLTKNAVRVWVLLLNFVSFVDLLNCKIDVFPNLPVFHSTAMGETTDGMALHPTFQEVTLAIK